MSINMAAAIVEKFIDDWNLQNQVSSLFENVLEHIKERDNTVPIKYEVVDKHNAAI